MYQTLRVLVVEQNQQARRELAKVIKQKTQAQTVDAASTGYEAVTKSVTQRPAVVLMNINIDTMMAGIFVCKEIIANAPDVQVILYGGDCSKDTVIRAFQAGAANVLLGDCTDLELAEAVLEAFDGKTSIHHSTATQLREEIQRIMNLHDNLTYVLNVLTKLTATELTILRHFNNGMRSQEIAKILFIGNTTMKTHISHILKKFNLETMVQVVEVLHLTELFSMIQLNSDYL